MAKVFGGGKPDTSKIDAENARVRAENAKEKTRLARIESANETTGRGGTRRQLLTGSAQGVVSGPKRTLGANTARA